MRAETLPGDEHEELIDYFRRMVEDVRLQDRGGELGTRSFQEALREVLDYRAWFEFHLYSKVAANPKTEITDQRFAARSGGEKSLATFIPLLAAAHARYRSAGPAAPRLIGLDEAFAGVDEQNTMEMFRFLVELDFCWVMASEKLWPTYACIPACAAYEMLRDGTTVASIPYLWNGHRLEEVPLSLAEATATRE